VQQQQLLFLLLLRLGPAAVLNDSAVDGGDYNAA
jgi:hypothetical protein